jgi:hypothetical protein
MMLVDDFFKMEKDYGLFDMTDENGVHVWDLLRMDVYLSYEREKLNKAGIPFLHKIAAAIKGVPSVISSLFSLLFKRADYIVFSASRYKDDDGLFYDKASENIVEALSPNVLSIERYKSGQRYRHKLEYNFISLSRSFHYKRKHLPKSVVESIDNALVKTFREIKVSTEELDALYSNFLFERDYYRRLFLLKKPKMVFFTQNGLQKGMCAAADSLSIRINETQHGMFTREHLAYSYPEGIDLDGKTFSPHFIYSFGEVWGKGLKMVAKVIPAGNDCFVPKRYDVPSDGSILFISSIIHYDFLKSLAVELAKESPSLTINFKLHPGEFFNKERYMMDLSRFRNIKVLSNEFDTGELIARSQLVVLVNSTVFYETLERGKKVAVYKVLNWGCYQGYQSLPNVFFFNDMKGLKDAFEAPQSESHTSFFDHFNPVLFKDTL